MIDFETKIFNRVHKKAAPLCAKNQFVSTQVRKPTGFPAAALVEMDNSTVRNRQSSTPVENYANLMYQLDVYALSKAECKKVFAAVDDEMISMNFDRMSGRYIDNPDNTKVFRYTARYEAMIDPDGNIYRRS